MNRAEYVLTTAQKVLADHYGVRDFSLSDEAEVGNMLFDHYQTIKYACDTKAGRQLLSVHVLNESTECIEVSLFFASQLLWLEALDRDNDMSIQAPIKNDHNELLTVIPGTPDILVSLTHWVSGELLEGEDERPLTHAQARDMGILLARLHRHSEDWTFPPQFTRPEHPISQVDTFMARLEPARADHRISAHDFTVLQRVAERVKSVLSASGRQRGGWGLLHGDFTASNCVIHESRLSPIDFDSCSVGPYLVDVAHCLLMHEADPAVTCSFLEGYQSVRDLDTDWMSVLEALTLAMALWDWSESVDRRSAFPTLPSWVARECEKYLCGAHFIFDEERTWL